jgi:hypothetical protein
MVKNISNQPLLPTPDTSNEYSNRKVMRILVQAPALILANELKVKSIWQHSNAEVSSIEPLELRALLSNKFIEMLHNHPSECPSLKFKLS